MTIRERLQALEEQRAALSHQISRFEAEREAALAALPQRFGYQSVDEFITAVTAAYAPQKRPARRRKATPPKAPEAKPAATETPVSSPATTTTLGDAPRTPALPTGSSLADPQNFGTLPDASLLDAPAILDSGYYDRVAMALTYARKVLGTSGVPAAVWRAWRSHEHKLSDILRNRHRQDVADL